MTELRPHENVLEVPCRVVISSSSNNQNENSRSCLLGLFLFVTVSSLLAGSSCDAFTASSSFPVSNERHRRQQQQKQQQHTFSTFSTTSNLHLIPPPGSGYIRSEEELYKLIPAELPETYEPMMGYPGTMRPGMTPENMPYQDLPIADTDPDPVPWPHFQQLEWHHRWSEPPHPHPGTMENFIDAIGRWATPEQEAAMRAGVRRRVQQQEELEEAEKREYIVTDDDDDDDYQEKDDLVSLGEGMFGKLGSDLDRAETAAAVSPSKRKVETDKQEEEDLDVFLDDDLDEFLLDLGLDTELEGDDNSDGKSSAKPAATIRRAPTDVGDDDDDDDEKVIRTDGATSTITVDDDDDLATLGLDDDDDDDTVSTVPLEDFGDSDSLDVEDIFHEGGFDYDEGDFGGDNDVW
jgi:hypothetical protein